MFGDPCPGTLKYLEAHYQCMPGMIDLLSMVMRLRLVKSVRVNKQGHLAVSRMAQTEGPWRLSTEQQQFRSERHHTLLCSATGT